MTTTISADDRLAEPGASVIGYNLYTYCDNSPVGATDYDGHFAICMVAGASITVGQVLAVTGVIILACMVFDYAMNPDSRENPVAVICNTISDQVVSIRNAKRNKNGEKTGKGKTETGEVRHQRKLIG